MSLLAGLTMLLAAAAAERTAIIVQAPDTPVRLEHATVLSGSDGPSVLLYSATNKTDQALDQFTVIAYIFDADGVLKATQLAPGRRTLEGRETKYSTMVLDGTPIPPGGSIVIGVNQAQRVDSDAWWRADIRPAAEAAAPKKKP
jgi:hypothetical protein